MNSDTLLELFAEYILATPRPTVAGEAAKLSCFAAQVRLFPDHAIYRAALRIGKSVCAQFRHMAVAKFVREAQLRRAKRLGKRQARPEKFWGDQGRREGYRSTGASVTQDA